MGLKEEYEAEEKDNIVRWLKHQVDEYRHFKYSESSGITPREQLLAFIYPNRLTELGDLLEQTNSDYFTEGAINNISYNGSDLVLDVLPILRGLNIDPKLVTEEYKES